MTEVRIAGRTVDVKWTMLDRMIAHVSPERGMARWKTRTLMAVNGVGGHTAGRKDRRAMMRWNAPAASADADTLNDLLEMRGRSRDLVRNTPLAAGALKTRVTGVVGGGLTLIASVDHVTLGISEQQADAMEREQELEFALFWATCDLSQVQHGDELATLAYSSQSESGDAFVVRRYKERPGEVYGTKLQLLEADRVSNPNRQADSETLSGGIEYDADGAPVAFHVSDRHPGNLRTAKLSWERVAARDENGRQLVIHLFDRTRPELSRGVPWIAPVVELLKQLGNYTDAEVMAAVVTAMYTVFIETAVGEDSDENPVAGEADSSLNDNEIKLASGAVISLAPGEKANIPQPMRPNAQFDPFFLAMTRQIGVALELPQELLIKHFTASYSASRAALEMAYQTFIKERKAHARRLWQVAYEWMMEEAVAKGRLHRPGFFADPRLRMAYCGAEWRGAPRPSLNPKQEAEADEIDMRNGVKTGEEVCASRTGGQIEKKISQRGKEVKLLRDAGIGPAPKADAPQATEQPDDDADAEDDKSNTRSRA